MYTCYIWTQGEDLSTVKVLYTPLPRQFMLSTVLRWWSRSYYYFVRDGLGGPLDPSPNRSPLKHTKGLTPVPEIPTFRNMRLTSFYHLSNSTYL